MHVALVHDQLAEFGGAERVLISLKKAFPAADVYTSFVDKKRLGEHWKHFEKWNITQSWASHFPFFTKLYSPLRFLLPAIWRSFDLSHYDIVICSSSWGMCKGVSLAKSETQMAKSNTESNNARSPFAFPHSPTFLCYLHTPPRYLYGYDESDLKKYWPVKLYALIVNHFLRQYDYESSQTIDQFIFNSQEIRSRSLKFYRKDGIILHPPIQQALRVTSSPDGIPWDLSRSGGQTRNSKLETRKIRSEKPYYLTVSRLAPTKHIDVLIKAANEGGFTLKIVGTGKEYARLKALAGPTVELLGGVSDEKLSELYAGAKAFLYASVNEDFGMVPVEAMAYGTPVIAFASGGVKETVQDGKNGFLYSRLDPQEIILLVKKLESLTESEYHAMQQNARTFADSCSEVKFISAIKALANTPSHAA